jgi:hypothetical protein
MGRRKPRSITAYSDRSDYDSAPKASEQAANLGEKKEAPETGPLLHANRNTRPVIGAERCEWQSILAEEIANRVLRPSVSNRHRC